MIIVSDHAYYRAKERLSLKPHALEKLAERAYDKGISFKESKGELKKYLEKPSDAIKWANNIRIYGEVAFVFNDNVLITVYQIPSRLKHHLKYHKKYGNADNSRQTR